jgi:hypothetical protein
LYRTCLGKLNSSGFHIRLSSENSKRRGFVLFCFVGVGLDWPLGATLRAICDEEDHQ